MLLRYLKRRGANKMIHPFWYLLLAHTILDYPLQGNFLGTGKKHYNFLLLIHCIIWTLGHCVILDMMQLYQPWMLWWLFIGHIIMDYLKLHHLARWFSYCIRPTTMRYTASFTKENTTIWTDPLGVPLWVDQGFHLMQIAVCLL